MENKRNGYYKIKTIKGGYTAVVIHPNGKISSILLDEKKDCFGPYFANYPYIVENNKDLEFGNNAGKRVLIAYSPDNKMRFNKIATDYTGIDISGPLIVWSKLEKIFPADIKASLLTLKSEIDLDI